MVALLVTSLLAGCGGERQEGGIETFYTRGGQKVVITCIKHASLQINYRGLEFEIDPVASAYQPIIDYTDKPKADFILVTHDHYDHFDPNAIFLLTKRNTYTFIPLRCQRRCPQGVVLRNGDRAQLASDVWLQAIPAYNTTLSRRDLHPRGVGNGYLLSLGGFRIYIAGDTEPTPEMLRLRNIDVAFLPCNQPYTMSMKQIRQAARTLHPRVLIPYHTGTASTDSIRQALSGLGIDVRMRYMK